MKFVVIALAIVVVATLRVVRRRRRLPVVSHSRTSMSDSLSGVVSLIVAREVRERVRGRVFKLGTVIILLVVATAIVIPVLHSSNETSEKIGVVGTLSSPLRATVTNTAKSASTTVRFVPESSVNEAKTALRTGRINAAVVNAHEVIVKDPSAATPLLRSIAENLGVTESLQAAHLSPSQSETLSKAKALPITSVQPGKRSTGETTSLIGTILIFIMLSQYTTWILMGVMEEKSSRVIEVLLSAVRPIQLLTGKVLGIGLVAMAQATFVVAFALILSKAVGSDLLHGTAPLVIASTLVWLVLGYAFYSWVYAAAGSMVERQDQVQSLVLPLSLPMLFGYITALTGASSGSPSALLKVLAYLPPTAPFAMPVLVGFGEVTWWAFLGSVMISLTCTIGVARGAATVYRRAILRTGARVRLREVFSKAVR
jgi:ABC-2 type transport system permease protein